MAGGRKGGSAREKGIDEWIDEGMDGRRDRWMNDRMDRIMFG